MISVSGSRLLFCALGPIGALAAHFQQQRRRALIIQATGTGKTYTTFQIIYRLWKAKKAKRILFLVDRNILADQVPGFPPPAHYADLDF